MPGTTPVDSDDEEGSISWVLKYLDSHPSDPPRQPNTSTDMQGREEGETKARMGETDIMKHLGMEGFAGLEFGEDEMNGSGPAFEVTGNGGEEKGEEVEEPALMGARAEMELKALGDTCGL